MRKVFLSLTIVFGVFASLHAQTSYDSLTIVVRNDVQIQSLQMRSDQDTLLQVLGKQSTDGRWVPVPGNWVYTATLGGTNTTGQSLWRFSPGDTGTGRITVSMGNAVSYSIPVRILHGLPNSVVLYNSELPPNPSVVKLGDPGQMISIAAGTQYLLVAKAFDWKGVWLSQYQISDNLKSLFSWGASDRSGSLNTTLDGLTGAVRRFTPTKAWDTVTIIDTLKINGINNLIDTVRFAVGPGPAKRLVIEPKGPPKLNDPLFANELDTLRLLSNEQSKSAYATVRDPYGNFVRYANVSAWGSLDTQVVSVNIGDGNFGEGIVTRFPAATNSLTKIHATDAGSALKDSCSVTLISYYYSKLRIVIGSNTDPASFVMNTNQDTTVRVQGLRSTDNVWVDVSATWQTSANLRIDPAAPVGHSWRFSPSDTGTGWIRVTMNNDGVILPDTLPVRFTPGPPVRASIEIITPPESMIAGKPIHAVVRIYDKDGHGYTHSFDTTAGKGVSYFDGFNNTLAMFPEPTIIINGKTASLARISNQTFLNGRDTVSFTLFIAPFDTTQRHQFAAHLTRKDTVRIGGRDSVIVYTVTTTSAPFVLHPDKLAEITIAAQQGYPLTDTIRLTQPVTIISIGYDKYGNWIGMIAGNWSVTDSLHPITGPVTGSSIAYDPRGALKTEQGHILVNRDGVKDSIYVIIAGPPVRLVLAITRDYSGNGILDHLELHFSRGFSLPANASFTGLSVINFTYQQRDTLVVNRILNTGGTIDDSVWVVELTERHSDKPQTGWTPTVYLPLQNEYDLAETMMSAIDGAGPVVWSVTNYNVLPNSHEQDTVIVTLSEPVRRYDDGGSLNINDKPADIFYVWTRNPEYPMDTTRYILVEDMLKGTLLKRVPGSGSGNSLVFTMSNGNDISPGYTAFYLSLADSTKKYVTDARAVPPNTNNNPKIVMFSRPVAQTAEKKQECGCGVGTGLAFLPPLCFKWGAIRNRRRKKLAEG